MTIDTYPPVHLSTPNAVLGYAENKSMNTNINAALAIPGLSLTVFVLAGRRIRITAHSQLYSDSAVNDAGRVRIKEGTTTLGMGTVAYGANSMVSDAYAEAILSPSAGSHTYIVEAIRITGDGNNYAYADAESPSYILVEDITGGTGGPGPIHLAYAQVTANQGSIVGTTDLTGLNVTVNVPAGRRIKVSCQFNFQGTAATNGFELFMIEDSTTLNKQQIALNVANESVGLQGMAISSPTAGTHTYKLMVGRVTGSGTGTLIATSIAPAFILVEDITGTPMPAGYLSAPVTLGYAERLTNIGPFTAETDMVVAPTITVSAGRRIRISAYQVAYSSAVNTALQLQIKEGATTLEQVHFHTVVADQSDTFYGSVILSPSTGSHTYKATMMRAAGTGNITAQGNANMPAWILVEDITGWATVAPLDSVPVGALGYAQIVAHQGGIVAKTDIVGLSVNIVVPAGRRIKITASTHIYSTVTTDEAVMFIMEGSTDLQTVPHSPLAATSFIESFHGELILSPSAGSHTYKVAVQRTQGTGTLQVYAQPWYPAFILVEDITPTPAPANTAPSSTLAYAQVITGQGSITSEVDVTGTAVTFTVPAGRRVKVTAKILTTSSVTGDNLEIMLKEGSAYLGNAHLTCGSAGYNEAIHCIAVVSPSAGSHTYRATFRRASGSGIVSIYADANVPTYILVEDITPQSMPVPASTGLWMPATVFPSNPILGDMFFEQDTEILWVYRSTGWTMLAGNTPACRVRHSVNQGLNSDAPAVLQFDTELQDWSVTSMHDTVTNTSRITVSAAGWYSLGASAEVAAGADYIRQNMRLKLNGGSYIVVHEHHPETGGYTVNNHISVATDYYLGINDYVEVEMTQRNGAGTARNVNATTHYTPQFWAVWLRP